MRAVFAEVCQALTVVSYCMPGSPHSQAAWAMARHSSRAFLVSTARPSSTARVENGWSFCTASMNSSVTRTLLLRVLEEHRLVRLAVEAAVVAGVDQRPGLLLFLGLAPDELFHVGVVDVQDDHLGRAPGLAARLDDAGEGVEAAHEADRAARRCRRRSGTRCDDRMGDRLVPVPEPYLNSMPSVWASFRMDPMVSSTLLMKQAEHCGSASMPTLNQTGELNDIFWLTSRCFSSARKFSAESLSAK